MIIIQFEFTRFTRVFATFQWWNMINTRPIMIKSELNYVLIVIIQR